jgi:hypothetical protein
MTNFEEDISHDDLIAAAECYDRLVFRKNTYAKIEAVWEEGKKLNFTKQYVIECIEDILNHEINN